MFPGKEHRRRKRITIARKGRRRPHNFPHRRIALLAQLVASDFRLVRKITSTESIDSLRELFRQPLTGYWACHFTFGPGSERNFDTLSRNSADILIINVAIPLLMAYGNMHGDEEMTRRAVEWLQELPPESNSIVTLFSNAGIGCKDAFTSQALIQLRRRYCEERKCLYCRLGHSLLARHARRR